MTTYNIGVDLTDDELEALIYTVWHSATAFAPGGGSTGDFYASADQREYGRTALTRAKDVVERIGCPCPQCRRRDRVLGFIKDDQ